LSTPVPPPRGGRFVLFATALLTGLASGALCCLLALVIKQDPTWLMLPAAFAVGAFMRWQRFSGAPGAIAAAGAMLICVAYTEYIYAAVRMADMLGFPLRDTLFRVDWQLALQIARANAGVVEAAVFVLAPALAAAMTARTARA
jgi:hypothetical protein